MSAHRPQLLQRTVSVLLLATLVLSGCAGSTIGGGDTAPSATVPLAEPIPLECETAPYPCSLGAVAPDVAERARVVGRDAAHRVAGGESITEVATWLQSQPGVATVDTGEVAVRFRLEGGRHVWVMPRSADSPMTAVVPSRRQMTASWSSIDSGRILSAPRPQLDPIERSQTDPALVLAEGQAQKKAIILSPYDYLFPETPSGSDIAQLLNETRGYAGGVTFLRNNSATDTTVDTNAFAHLAGNNVIYIDSLGGTITRRDKSYGVIAAHDVHGSDTFKEAQVQGLDNIVWTDGGEAVGLSADFFRTWYPGAIQDAIIVLGAQDLGDGDLIASLLGSTSEIYYWDGPRDGEAAAELTYQYLKLLSTTGRTTESMYREVSDHMVVDDARFVGGTLPGASHTARIREVVWLRDPKTGAALRDGDAIEIDGTLGDGQADLIPFVVDVEGIDPGDENKTTFNVTIDGIEVDPFNAADGDNVADGTWRIESALSHDDLQEAQKLEVDALVQLPEGGYSRETLELTVTGKKVPEIGRVWEGTASTTLDVHGGDSAVKISVNVRLVRDPSDDPGQKHVSFVLERGTLQWSIGGSSDDCSFEGDSVEVEMPASEYDVLTFHRPDDPNGQITYDGIGEFDDGPSVTVRQTCDTVQVEYEQEAEGTWFRAPRDAGFVLDGDTIQGEYGRYLWSLHRVE